MDLLEREDPLRSACTLAEQARKGRGSILLVTGEAGIGKSSLIALLLEACAQGQRVLCGGCEDLFSPRPLGPLRDIAQAQPDAMPEALDFGAPADVVFAAFFRMLNTSVISSIVVLEDVHWADEATLDLIKYLGRRIDRLPVLLVLSYREDELGPEHPLGQVLGDLPSTHLTRLTLRPLSAAAVTILAGRAGRPDDGLHAATGGNPFYVTEVLASGVADARQGVPSTVRDAVRTRLARLSNAERGVLHALSVVPGRVELWLAHRLLDADSMEAVDACVARGVLVTYTGSLAFRHELARRATLDTLPPMQRQAWHARALAALLAPPAGVTMAPLTRLVHHACEAGDTACVLELAPRAAQEAAAVGAHREAAMQLSAALRFADGAPPAMQAQLHESWSYEAGLSLAIDARVIDARHRAIGLWRRLGRLDKVGHNLRWLSRLHWYQGDSARAERYTEEAVSTLEQLPPGPELAWAYSVRSQHFMLQDRTDLAVLWGERAMALAERLGEHEILCHALNSVGTAEMFAGRPGGQQKLERSLALARKGGYHEQAARVYTNISEYTVVFKDHVAAERWLLEGIEFDRLHDLDAWTHYLVGWLAQLRLEQGQLDEAVRIAREVLSIPRLTAVMRLPALTVLARACMRRGEPEAPKLLDEARSVALSTSEVQRIVPVVTAIAEGCWLRGDRAGCAAALRPLDDHPDAQINAWDAGEVAAWRLRARQANAAVPPHAAAPWQLELAGDPQAAAMTWRALGAPNEAGLALLRAAELCPREGAAAMLRQALEILEPIGSRLAVERVRALARGWGLERHMPGRRRGPYAQVRKHPRGLSGREQQVLDCLARGMSNAEIALQLDIAVRTVEHHVTGILSKLATQDRARAVEVARGEGLLPAHP